MTQAKNLKNIWLVPCVVTIVSFAQYDDTCLRKISFEDHPSNWRDILISTSSEQSTNDYAAHRQCARDANSLSSNDGKS